MLTCTHNEHHTLISSRVVWPVYPMYISNPKTCSFKMTQAHSTTIIVSSHTLTGATKPFFQERTCLWQRGGLLFWFINACFIVFFVAVSKDVLCSGNTRSTYPAGLWCSPVLQSAIKFFSLLMIYAAQLALQVREKSNGDYHPTDWGGYGIDQPECVNILIRM